MANQTDPSRQNKAPPNPLEAQATALDAAATATPALQLAQTAPPQEATPDPAAASGEPIIDPPAPTQTAAVTPTDGSALALASGGLPLLTSADATAPDASIGTTAAVTVKVTATGVIAAATSASALPAATLASADTNKLLLAAAGAASAPGSSESHYQDAQPGAFGPTAAGPHGSPPAPTEAGQAIAGAFIPGGRPIRFDSSSMPPTLTLGPGNVSRLVDSAEVITGLPGANAEYHLTVTGALSGGLAITLEGMHDDLVLATNTGVSAIIAGAEHVVGTDHGDNLTVASGFIDNPVSVQGGAGNDTITANGIGAITIEGGGGNNILSGTDAVRDTLSYAHAATGVTVDLGSTVVADNGAGGSDTIAGFEHVVGSAHDDTITLGSSVDAYGAAYTASVDGGAGSDVVHLAGMHTAVSVSNVETVTLAVTASGAMATIIGAQQILGSDHGDILTVDAGDVLGGAGNDSIAASGTGPITIDGGGGNNTLTGGTGDQDTLSYAHAGSGVTVNLSTGRASDNGAGGSDTISGFERVLGSAHDDVMTTRDTTGTHATIDGGAGNDTVLLAGDRWNNVIVSNVERVDVVGTPLETQVTVRGPVAAGATFDLRGGSYDGQGPSTLVFEAAETQTILSFGSHSNDIHVEGVSYYWLQGGGPYHVTFDGTVFATSTNVNYQGDASLYFDASLEVGHKYQVSGGSGADTFIGNKWGMLEMAASTVTLTSLHDSALSGSVYDDDGRSTDTFTNFGIVHTGAFDPVLGFAPGDLVIAADATGISSIDLRGNGSISGAGGQAGIYKFNDVTNLSSTGLKIRGSDAVFPGSGDQFPHNRLTAGSGGDTLTGGGGADTLTGGAGADRYVYLAASDSVFDGQPAHTDLIQNFQDSGTSHDVLDVASVSSVQQHFTSDKSGLGTDLTAAFADDVAGDVSYAVFTTGGHSTTFVHVASGNGYDANDLIIRLDGAHALTADNFALATGPAPGGGGSGSGSSGGGGSAGGGSGGGGSGGGHSGSGADCTGGTITAPGASVVTVIAGSHTLTGGDGANDALSYATATGGVVVDLHAHVATSNGFGGTDSIVGFEHVMGSAHDDVITTDTTINPITGGYTTWIDGGCGYDIVHLGGSFNLVTVTNVERVDVIGTPDASYIHVLGAINPGMTIDLTGSKYTDYVEFNQTDPTSLVLGSGADDIHLINVGSIFLNGGSFNVTLDGTVLAHTNNLAVYAQGASPLYFDASLETEGGSAAVQGSTGADTMIGSRLWHLYIQDPTATVTVTSLTDDGFSGTSADGATTDVFTNFGTIQGSVTAHLTLNIADGATGISTVDLKERLASEGTNAGSLEHFDNVTNLSGTSLKIIGDDGLSWDHHTVYGNTLTAGRGGDTLTGNGAGDTLVGGAGSDHFVYLKASDSRLDAAGGNVSADMIRNFQDTGTHADVLDVAAVSAIAQHFAGDKTGVGTDVATAFAGAAAGDVSFAVINSTTYVHVASGAGYSANDLVVQLDGGHALTGANFHLHP